MRSALSGMTFDAVEPLERVRVDQVGGAGPVVGHDHHVAHRPLAAPRRRRETPSAAAPRTAAVAASSLHLSAGSRSRDRRRSRARGRARSARGWRAGARGSSAAPPRRRRRRPAARSAARRPRRARANSSSEAPCRPQPSCITTTTSSVPSRRCEALSDRIASSVTRPPALRMMWASPRSRPSIGNRSIRVSMHARTATLRRGRGLEPGRGELVRAGARRPRRMW